MHTVWVHCQLHPHRPTNFSSLTQQSYVTTEAEPKPCILPRTRPPFAAHALLSSGQALVRPPATEAQHHARVVAGLLHVACGGLDQAHNLVTPLCWGAPTPYAGRPIAGSAAAQDASYVHALVHRAEVGWSQDGQAVVVWGMCWHRSQGTANMQRGEACAYSGDAVLVNTRSRLMQRMARPRAVVYSAQVGRPLALAVLPTGPHGDTRTPCTPATFRGSVTARLALAFPTQTTGKGAGAYSLVRVPHAPGDLHAIFGPPRPPASSTAIGAQHLRRVCTHQPPAPSSTRIPTLEPLNLDTTVASNPHDKAGSKPLNSYPARAFYITQLTHALPCLVQPCPAPFAKERRHRGTPHPAAAAAGHAAPRGQQPPAAAAGGKPRGRLQRSKVSGEGSDELQAIHVWVRAIGMPVGHMTL